MFELPKFTPVEDNTGALLLKSADQARQRQEQITSLIQKNEQARQEAFGGAQKQLFEIASAQNVPAEVQKQILEQGMANLTALYRDRKNVNAGDIQQMAMGTIMNAKNTATAYQQYLANGEKIVADLKEKSHDELNLKSALVNNMYETREVMTPAGPQVVRVPKDPSKLDDPIQFLAKEVELRPDRYIDMTKADKNFTTMMAGLKPGKLEMSDKQDLTGSTTVSTSWTEEKYPFTRTEEVQQYGKKAKVNVLDTYVDPDLSKARGVPTQLMKPEAVDFFINNPDPGTRNYVRSLGQNYINDHNRRLGLNPQQITPENVTALLQQYPEMIDPYNEKNRTIFTNLALTEKLMPQFGKFGDVKFSYDRAKPQSTTVVVPSDVFTKSGDIKENARYAVAARKLASGDREILTQAEPISFTYNGAQISAKRTGDILYGQFMRTNGRKVTIANDPNDLSKLYVVELDEKGNPTRNVEVLEGQADKERWFRLNASANKSSYEAFPSQFQEAGKLVTAPTSEDVNISASQAQLGGKVKAGKDFVSRKKVFASKPSGQMIDLQSPALIDLNGENISIKGIRRNTKFFGPTTFDLTLEDGSTKTITNEEFLAIKASSVDPNKASGKTMSSSEFQKLDIKKRQEFIASGGKII